MAYQFPPDVDEHIKSHMARGQYRSQDDVLRDALRALDEQNAVLGDIHQGIEDLEAGRGRRLEQVDADLRKKYNIPHDA